LIPDDAASRGCKYGRQRRLGPCYRAGDGAVFAFGFCTVLVDSIIPKLKATFALSYAEVMLTQFCFFGAYFLVSLPAAWLHSRIGYLRGVAVGLLLMAAGCLLFTPAADAGVYPGFLLALFILASGVTIVQVAANPLATGAGAPERAPSRLTLAQAFNSLATTIGPIFGASFILSQGLAVPDASTLPAQALAIARREQAQVFQMPFLIIAGVLIVMAVLCWRVRHWVTDAAPSLTTGNHASLLTNRRLMFGAVSIFVYVGAEVTIGSSMANYLMLGTTLSVAAQTAGSLVSIYWGLAMVGRFIGAGIMRKANPSLVLTCLRLRSVRHVGDIESFRRDGCGCDHSVGRPVQLDHVSHDLCARG